MTIGIEKIFFKYILQNKKYFDIVETHYFKNNDTKFVYNIIRKYMLKNVNANIPSNGQILEMVVAEDIDGNITKEMLRSLLSLDLNDYDEDNFIIPRFNSWIIACRIKDGTANIIDESRILDTVTDYDTTISMVAKIKSIVETMSNTSFINEDEDLGSDFDDIEKHSQDLSICKVPTGIKTLDHMVGGGLDLASLNVIMAESGAGKSLWMQNIATNCANLGYNVLYISLEMSERKVFKRIGAMRLKIPVNDYDRVSTDADYMAKKIEDLRNSNNGDFFEKKSPGKIYCKFWAAGTATADDFDKYIQKLYDKKGIKFQLIIIDYLTLMVPGKIAGGDTLYVKGKSLAESARALGAKHGCPVLTAVQVAKDAWGKDDITLSSVPESKAIVETADLFAVIIRTSEMQKKNIYRFKILKQRDGEFLAAQLKINLNPAYLSLENDSMVDDK